MKTNLLFATWPFLKSEKVTLSQITETDLESLWKILSDDENFRFNPNAASATMAEAATKIKQIHFNFREKKSITLGIFSNDSLNQLIGFMELTDINVTIHSISLAFMLNQEYSGKGYATAAVNCITDYLFQYIEVNRIQAYIMPNNLSSQRLLERCGFVKEGTIRDGFYWPDKGIIDLDLYAMLPTDFRKHQKNLEENKRYYTS
ncbi:GNAT family N-acetyltransferase [Scatolibacter rhodanostii]|uniref:GNAT family N-acetyltransferase n=1 Tax=Scatolibacter rhodanostii TaxID=2014781 RepID=UPI0013563691|nr:GNAT family protein [Scatolibacter rhodanostii]